MPSPETPLDPEATQELGATFGGRTVVEVLDEEHRQLAALLVELADPPAGTDEPRRKEIADAFTAALSRHLSGEEQDLFPAARKALPAGDEIIDREIAADRRTLLSLAALHETPAADPDFDRHIADLDGHVQRHTEIVSGEIFPELHQRLSREELVKLGNRIDLDREAAPSRPHPGTPSTPPWNRVIDPALGAVDKVRDAVAGRTAYPEDLAR